MVEEMNSDVKTLKKGDIVRGKITKVEDKQAFVDVGYKVDGVIPIGEVSNIHIEQVNDLLNVGDEVELSVIKLNDEEETLILSKKAVDSEKAWDILNQKLKSGEVFEVQVAEIVKGGLVVDVGVRGFIPASLVERHFVEDFSDYKGRKLKVKVVELDQEKNKVILSQKVVLDEIEKEKKKEVLDAIKVGDIKEGTVQRLTDFGAFVDIGGVDGLVHVSEIDWERVSKPSDVLKEGEKVKVKVLRIEPENNRISLSIKETKESPFGKVISEFKVGEIYTGKVKRLANFGAFVEIAPKVEGLVHISQISDDHISKPSDVLEAGQEVKVKVLDIDTKNERVSLSIKEAEEKAAPIEYADNDAFNVTLGDLLGDKLKKLK